MAPCGGRQLVFTQQRRKNAFHRWRAEGQVLIIGRDCAMNPLDLHLPTTRIVRLPSVTTSTSIWEPDIPALKSQNQPYFPPSSHFLFQNIKGLFEGSTGEECNNLSHNVQNNMYLHKPHGLGKRLRYRRQYDIKEGTKRLRKNVGCLEDKEANMAVTRWCLQTLCPISLTCLTKKSAFL